jgi:hypothetical protein
MMTPQTIARIRDLSRTLAEEGLETQLPVSKVVYGEIASMITADGCSCRPIAEEDGGIVYHLSADQPDLLRDSVFAILAQTLRALAE